MPRTGAGFIQGWVPPARCTPAAVQHAGHARPRGTFCCCATHASAEEGGGGTSRLASGQAGAQLGGELAGRLGDQARPGRAAAGKVHQILERIGQRAASHSPVRWQRISLGAGTPAEDRGRHESHACGPAFKWCCTGRSQRAPSWLAPSIVSRQKSGPVPGLCNHGRQLAARLQR